MSLDSSFLRQSVQPVQMPDPMQVYSRYLNLRQLADQRRYREQQYRAQELLARQREQDMAERDQAQRAIATMDPNKRYSYADYVQHLGFKYGPAGYKAQEEALKAGAEREKEQTDVLVKRLPILANRAEALYRIDDMGQRQALFDNDTKDFLEAGFITPEEAERGMANDPLLERIIRRGKGDEHFIKLQGDLAKQKEERDKAADEADERKWKAANYFAGSVKNQESLERFRDIAPEKMLGAIPEKFDDKTSAQIGNVLLTEKERREAAQVKAPTGQNLAFETFFAPGWYQEHGITKPTAADTTAAWKAFQKTLATPQMSVGMTPEAEAQQKRLREKPEPQSTGLEKTTLGFYQRLKGAEDVFKSLESHISKMGWIEQGRLKYTPDWANFTQSPENQMLQTAMRQFTEARLRKESGAAIPPHEYESDRKMFFPQPGDDPKNLALKARNRASLMNSYAFQSGRAYKEYYGEEAPRGEPAAGTGQGAPTSGVPKVGGTFNGETVRKVTKVE